MWDHITNTKTKHKKIHELSNQPIELYLNAALRRNPFRFSKETF
jgi:hypothetical protein